MSGTFQKQVQSALRNVPNSPTTMGPCTENFTEKRDLSNKNHQAIKNFLVLFSEMYICYLFFILLYFDSARKVEIIKQTWRIEFCTQGKGKYERKGRQMDQISYSVSIVSIISSS